MNSFYELIDVFTTNQNENQKQYQIQNFENISKFLEIFKKNKETKKYPLNSDGFNFFF